MNQGTDDEAPRPVAEALLERVGGGQGSGIDPNGGCVR